MVGQESFSIHSSIRQTYYKLFSLHTLSPFSLCREDKNHLHVMKSLICCKQKKKDKFRNAPKELFFCETVKHITREVLHVHKGSWQSLCCCCLDESIVLFLYKMKHLIWMKIVFYSVFFGVFGCVSVAMCVCLSKKKHVCTDARAETKTRCYKTRRYAAMLASCILGSQSAVGPNICLLQGNARTYIYIYIYMCM